MIQVNFFKKEKTNRLPQIALSVFIVLFVIIIAYILLSRFFYSQSISNNQAYLTNNADRIEISHEMEELDLIAQQSADVQSAIIANRYPMSTIIEEIIATVPNEDNMINSIQITESTSEVSLILENMTTQVAHDIVAEIDALSFVEGVQLLSATTTGEESNQMQYEIIVNLTEEVVVNAEGE